MLACRHLLLVRPPDWTLSFEGTNEDAAGIQVSHGGLGLEADSGRYIKPRTRVISSVVPGASEHNTPKKEPSKKAWKNRIELTVPRCYPRIHALTQGHKV